MSRTPRHLPFEADAGFDDPLGTLLGCHRRIEKQLAVLKQLKSDVAARGVSPEASAAALSLLKYFDRAAVHHHEDEELDLFPLLEARITDPGERARFDAFRATLSEDHRAVESAWSRLRRALEAIADGRNRPLGDEDVVAFVRAYAQHIVAEENALTDFFNRWLDDGDRERLGAAMAERRRQDMPRVR